MTGTKYLAQSSDSVLVVVDLQEKLTASMPPAIREKVILQVKNLLIIANILSIPVMVTEQYPKGLGPTEADVAKQLAEDALKIEKTTFSCARATGFTEALEAGERKQIILCGMETHICILQTALELQEQGYQVFVIEDAVSSRSKSSQYNALQRLRQAGVIVTNIESIIFEWLGDASHPKFKNLVKLII